MDHGPDDLGAGDGSSGSRGPNVIAAFVTMFATASVAVGLRLYTRVKFLHGLKVEDWLILVAWVFSLGVTIGFIRQTTLALGRHVWTLSPEILRASAMEEWYSFLFYVLSLCFTKTSILLLYRRILPLGPARTANHILLAFVTACNVFAVVVSFATCVPLEAAWDKRGEGKCLGLVVQLGNSILNIVTDFAIFLLPLPSIVGLRMHWRRKAGLLFVFALGFVVCLISMIRLIFISKMDKTDMTYDLAVVAYWGAVEVNLPIICACLATIRPLLNKLLPGFLGPRSSQDGNPASLAMSSQLRYAPGDSMMISQSGARRRAEGVSTSEESLVFIMQDVEREGLEAPGRAYGRSVKPGVYE